MRRGENGGVSDNSLPNNTLNGGEPWCRGSSTGDGFAGSKKQITKEKKVKILIFRDPGPGNVWLFATFKREPSRGGGGKKPSDSVTLPLVSRKNQRALSDLDSLKESLR